MAARTDYASVIGIIETNLSEVRVNTLIDTANMIVNVNLTGSGLSTETLTEIEKWVAAHLIAFNSERQAQKKKVGDGEETYSSLGQMLKATTYGQTAVMLDSTGTLNSSSKITARINAIPQFEDSELLD